MHFGYKRSKSTRLGILSITALFLGTFVWFFWFQILIVAETHYSYRHIPIASMTPLPLLDDRIAAVAGTKLACFGYEFEVPWQDATERRLARKTRMAVFPFQSGLELLVSQGSTHNLVDTMLGSQDSVEYFRIAYGDKVLQSDYEFLKLALNTTPGSIRLFAPKQDVASRATLLLFKAFVVPGDSGIFYVQANDFKGFQYGDPSKHPTRVTLTLYSADDGLEFVFANKDLKPLAISQAEINRVLYSVHHTRTPAVTSSSNQYRN